VTAAASKIPVSVDYTGRDYYALREALIERVKSATNNQWQGTDASDFGLVLIEAFAYMGDLTNYYIDRIANEAYLFTATQRQTLLNLASMYGYTPTGYVGSVVDVTFTSSAGYSGQVGASILEEATFNNDTYPHVAQLVIPNNNPFTAGDSIIVTGMTSSAYNGRWTVLATGKDAINRPVVAYQPKFDITNIVNGTGTFTVTTSVNHGIIKDETIALADVGGYNGNWLVDSASENTLVIKPANNTATINFVKTNGSGEVTYSAVNDFIVGQKVTITGVSPTAYNLTNATVASVTKTNAIVTMAASAGSSKSIYTVSQPITVGQVVTVTSLLPIGYNLTNAVVTDVANLTATITGVAGSGSEITYTANNTFVKGQYVHISGVTPTEYNGVAVITFADATTFKIAGTATSAYSSGGSAVVYQFKAANSENATFTQGGYAVVNQFTVANSATGTYSSGGVATPSLTGATYSSGGNVYYANLPAANYAIPTGMVYTVGTTTVPAGTQLQAEVSFEDKTQQVMFTTTSDAVVGHMGNVDNSVVVQAIQGEDVSYRAANLLNPLLSHDINGELIGTSTGSPDQTFKLAETIVDKNLINIFVDEGTYYSKWQQVQHISDFGPSASVYSVSVNASGTLLVNFGDGVSGAIPPQGASIKAQYFVGGGPIGNVGLNTINTIVSVPTVTSTQETTLKTKISVTNNSAAAGGADPESNDVIRYNAPRSLRALNRAVTLEDYGNLALSYRGVGKANATAEAKTSVTVYVAPTNTSNEVTPGLSSGLPLASQVQLQSDVHDYLSDKSQIGTTITVTYPDYVPVNVEVTYTALPQYLDATVRANLTNKLLNSFSYNYVDFEDIITPEEVEFKLRQVDGVQNVKVTALHRSGGSGRTSLIGSPSEIFVFIQDNLTLTAAPNDATLHPTNGLDVLSSSVSIGTWNQAFNPAVTDYTVTLPNSTTSVDIKPILNDAVNALVTVNNSVVASGSTKNVNTSVGNTVVVVSVTAGDGVTVRNYKLTLIRVS